MPRIIYADQNFHAKSIAIIDKADEICREYGEQGYDLIDMSRDIQDRLDLFAPNVVEVHRGSR